MVAVEVDNLRLGIVIEPQLAESQIGVGNRVQGVSGVTKLDGVASIEVDVLEIEIGIISPIVDDAERIGQALNRRRHDDSSRTLILGRYRDSSLQRKSGAGIGNQPQLPFPLRWNAC